MSAVLPTDKTLVNRAGVDHSSPADMSTVQDTDLLLINRAGVDYKCTFLDWKNSQSKPPNVGAVTLADVAGGDRFTGVAFPVSATMTEDGVPTSTKKLKAYVEGALKITPISDVITNVAGNVLTFATDKDLANFAAGDPVHQDDSKPVSTPLTGTYAAEYIVSTGQFTSMRASDGVFVANRAYNSSTPWSYPPGSATGACGTRHAENHRVIGETCQCP